MKNWEDNGNSKKKHKLAVEEEDSDLLTLSLSLPSWSSLSQPNSSLLSPASSSSLHSSSFPPSPQLSKFSSSSSSTPNPYHSFPMQYSALHRTPFPLSNTHPLFPHSQILTEPPLLLPTTRPRSSRSQPVRIPRNPTHRSRSAKSETIPEPFPWATNRRATVHSLNYLRENQIKTITGKVECKTCESSYEIGFDLEAKFAEVSSFIAMNECTMHDRAPEVWQNPILPICKNCGNSVKLFISEKKRSINWLFLWLGQMLGCCTLGQLKYFCKHAKRFRTGAKDRILYLTYLTLYEQLNPTDPDVRFFL